MPEYLDKMKGLGGTPIIKKQGFQRLQRVLFEELFIFLIKFHLNDCLP